MNVRASAEGLGTRLSSMRNKRGITYHKGVVSTIESDGSATVFIDGDASVSPPLSVLGNAPVWVGATVEMIGIDGDFLILGSIKSGSIVTPTFNANWDNYDVATWGALKAQLIGNVVTLSGLVYRYQGDGTTVDICTLPVGFRPKNRIMHTALSRSGATTTTGFTRLDIFSTGLVQVINSTTGLDTFNTGIGNTYWVSLAGISFIIVD